MADKDEKMKVKLFHYLIRIKWREVNATLLPEGPYALQQLLKAVGKYCKPRKNETVEEYCLFGFFNWSQIQKKEYIIITELKTLASTCTFGNIKVSFIRNRVICGTSDPKLRERLLR